MCKRSVRIYASALTRKVEDVSVSTLNFNFTGSDNFCCLDLLAALKHSVYVKERTLFHTKLLRICTIVRCMMFLLIIKTVIY